MWVNAKVWQLILHKLDPMGADPPSLIVDDRLQASSSVADPAQMSSKVMGEIGSRRTIETEVVDTRVKHLLFI